MGFLIIQILLNVIVLGLVDRKYLKIYKLISYIFYPVLLTIMVLFNNDISINKKYFGIAWDITFLFYPNYYIMIILSVVIQILFNTKYLRLLKLKKNNA